MENVCFFVTIRQRICQSGVPVASENTYTNLSINDSIMLDNGYILTLSSTTNNSILLSFSNPSFGLNFSFTVENGSTTIFDLPIEGGTFRVAIFVVMKCCNCC